MNKLGLTPIRTVRTIASVVALMGMVLLAIQRVLTAVLGMAQDAVKLGLARYNNFTGRFAAQNFPEDKKLLGLLKEVQGILPQADTALTVLLVVSIVLLVVALVGLALPRQSAHVLVAVRILKWQPEVSEDAPEAEGTNLREALSKVGEVPLKKLAIPAAIVIVIALVIWMLTGVASKVEQGNKGDELVGMQAKALEYIQAQRSYFAKTKKIGSAQALQLPDSSSTDMFDYKISATRFLATSKTEIDGCPAGSKWQVSASTKGIFSVELSLYRGTPKDTSCVKLTPDYKMLGREKPVK